MNKHGIHVTPEEYYKQWDIPTTQAAISAAGFSQDYENWVWEKDHKPFTMEWKE